MPLITVLRNNVRLSAAPQYERLTRFVAERARQDKDTFQWGGRISTGAEGRAISFVAAADGFAELAAREQPDDMIRRLFGEGDGNSLIEALGEGVESTSYGVATIREDLSTQPAPPVARVPVRAPQPTATAPRQETTSWLPWNTKRQQ